MFRCGSDRLRAKPNSAVRQIARNTSFVLSTTITTTSLILSPLLSPTVFFSSSLRRIVRLLRRRDPLPPSIDRPFHLGCPNFSPCLGLSFLPPLTISRSARSSIIINQSISKTLFLPLSATTRPPLYLPRSPIEVHVASLSGIDSRPCVSPVVLPLSFFPPHPIQLFLSWPQPGA